MRARFAIPPLCRRNQASFENIFLRAAKPVSYFTVLPSILPTVASGVEAGERNKATAPIKRLRER